MAPLVVHAVVSLEVTAKVQSSFWSWVPQPQLDLGSETERSGTKTCYKAAARERRRLHWHFMKKQIVKYQDVASRQVSYDPGWDK